jgi:hypothetical protein
VVKVHKGRRPEYTDRAALYRYPQTVSQGQYFNTLKKDSYTGGVAMDLGQGFLKVRSHKYSLDIQICFFKYQQLL